MIPKGYDISPRTGALYSIDRTVTANYDYKYVANYENLPQEAMSQIRGRLAEHFAPSMKTVCDIGFGTGAFLSELHRVNPKATYHGFDVSPYPAPSFIKIEPNWVEKEWSLLTFFDSLEHFPHLDFVDRLKAKTIIVSVPYYHPYFGEQWFQNWKHRKAGEHLWHFTPQTLSVVFANYRCVFVGSPEDRVRVGAFGWPNILTMVFQR